ncbi:hypothetical protein L6R53_28750 [Myxococcota bacterium]|nr:hypothetical protein [Myxococcota bacterium]
MHLPRRLWHRLRRAASRPPAPRPAAPPPRAPPAPAWRLADPGLARLQPSDLDPRLLAGDPLAAATRLSPDLWALPVLTPQATARLLAELDVIDAWCAHHRLQPERPNTMNRYGLVLADFGLDGLAGDLRDQVVAPLAARLFADCGGDRLDGHHGFLVDYGPGGDRDLGLHVDDAEVTLNLCLEAGRDGGEIFFEGRRCMQHLDTWARPEEQVTVAHQPGMALLHAGKHRHGALPLPRGRRRNLVLWCRSAAWRQREQALLDEGRCPPWCGA